MRYEGDIYRPPSEAYSLLVQVTIGCTHNKCTFCKMYKDKKFRVRSLDEVLEDLAWARKQYRRVERMFLCDGDALALSNNRLMPILQYISENFPECQRVTVYGRATDVLKKTDEEMRELYEAGLTMVYIGAESGSDKVLKDVCKGETRRQLDRRSEEDRGLRDAGFGNVHIGPCGKGRMERTRHRDRNHDKRDGSLVRSPPYASCGAYGTYGKGYRIREAEAADSGGGSGGNASYAGEYQCDEKMRLQEQSCFELCLTERQSA